MFDKTIKKAIKVFVALAMIVASGTALQKNVSAEGSNTANNMYVQSNTIEDENEIVKPPFIQDNDQTEGSEKKNPNSNEGMVWTDKLVEKVDENGTYRITLYAQGFKYRYVNKDNERENQWLNPLKKDTTLSVTENIPDEFQYVDGSINVIRKDGIKTTSQVFDISDNTNIKLVFGASDIISDNGKNNGIAFDVEISFEVKLNTTVVARKVYETGKAESRFVPSIENYYYYTWGLNLTSYGFKDTSWNEGGNNQIGSMKQLNHIGIITLPNKNGETMVINGIGSQGNLMFNKVSGYEEKCSDSNYFYVDLVANYPNEKQFFQDNGVKKLVFYFYTVGSGSEKGAHIMFEIEYIDGSIRIFEPYRELGNNGGCESGTNYDLGEIIEKTDPQIRPGFTVEEDEKNNKVIVEKFENHGEIIFAEITSDNLVQDKTASLIDWDERTYQIDLYAAHNIQPTDKIANIMLMLDVSGSMPWFVTEPTGGTTSLSKLNENDQSTETLAKNNSTEKTIDKWKYKYYVKRKGEGDTDEYKPIAYDSTTDIWRYIQSHSDGSKVFNMTDDGLVKDGEDIYIRGDNDKTKLEAVQTALEYFIENLKNVSSDSKVAYVQFAGEVKKYSDFVDVNDIDIAKIINGTDLYGGTNHYAAFEKANEIIMNETSINNENTYAIMFSDGDLSKNISIDDKTIGVDDVTDLVDDGIKKNVKLLFGAGIFAQKADDSDNSGVESLKKWVSKDPDDNSIALIYIGKNSNELINKFSDIFGKITVQISDATVIDYIDSRFVITDERGEKLDVGATFAGGTIGLNNGQYYIKWNDVNLSYSEDGHKGWHQTIFVKAKEEYIGGNDVLTNGTGSGITVGSVHKEFNKPTVNVKVDFVVGNADETIFLGESLANNVQDRLFNGFKNSNGENLSIAPDGSALSEDDFEFTWYCATDGLSPLEYSKINDINEEKPTEETVYYLQVKLKGVDTSSNESLSNTDENDNVLMKTIYATNDMDRVNGVGEDLDEHHIEDYANSRSKYGVYIVDVVSGSITINKEIREITNNDTQGDPIFTFHIEGTSDAGTKVNEYRSVRFTKTDSRNKFVATIEGLEKGKYKITELDTIRYEFEKVSDNTATEYQAPINNNGKTVTCYIGYSAVDNANTDLNRRNVNVTYKNKLINKNDQSDTDIVINTFKKNSDGSISISGKHDHFDEVRE